jgi:hypothetical protein
MARSEELKAVQAALGRYFDPREVKWKPQSIKGARALAICYVDARAVMDRLDDVLGVDGWRTEYVPLANGSVECRLSVWLGGQWVAKADVGSQSEQPDDGDRVKAAYSDALKRAAVQFGVGRYLYRLGSEWVDWDANAKGFAKTPALPDWAVPDDCRPCGAEKAAQIAGLIETVCQRTPGDPKPDPREVTAKVLAEYQVPPARGLAGLRKKEAAAILQRLSKRVNELAKTGAAGDQQPAA